MIKKLAFALSMTTICANVNPTCALSRSEMVDTDYRSRIAVKKMARVKRVQEAHKMRLARRMMRTAKIEERKKSTLAKRRSNLEAKKASRVGIVKNKQERFNALTTRATPRGRSKFTKRRESVAPHKLETVTMILLQEPVKNIMLNHVVVPELIVKEPSVVAAPLSTLTTQPIPLVELQASRKAQKDESVEKVNESPASVQSFKHIQDLLDAPIETIRKRLESLDNSINQVKEIVQDSTAVITENIRPFLPEVILEVAGTSEWAPVGINEDVAPRRDVTPQVDSDSLEGQSRSVLFHPLDLDETKVDALDAQITNVGMKLQQFKDGLVNPARGATYDVYSVSAGHYLPTFSEDKKNEVRRLYGVSEEVKRDLASLEASLQAGDIFNARTLIQPRAKVEKLKDEFNDALVSLGTLQSWIDAAALQTLTISKAKEQKAQQTVSLGESANLATSTVAQPSAVENQVNTIFIQGKSMSYSLRAPELDKSKKIVQSFTSGVTSTMVQPQENETVAFAPSSSLGSCVSESSESHNPYMSELVFELDGLIDKSELVDPKYRTEVMRSSAYARAALNGEALSNVSSEKNLKDELISLKSALQVYNSLPPKEIEETRDQSAIQTWLGFVKLWADLFLPKF